ncbi:hypothetical protein N1J35_005039 [Escherichia coli]|nr:hypothetical protein [Escherichia coli]EFI1730942.1 hypothetical protein [Escherichia coli]EIG6649987.1 hypothetical protein [Escherichia coli]EJS0368615.1 hypothetical protein [Escherichia coli]ELI2547098.1 hypothetical protein [Escherichia coli]
MYKRQVTGVVNKTANVAAHAVVNAALAVAQGNNALAGVAGAATGEVRFTGNSGHYHLFFF